jgi:isatin hydrolase
VKAWEAKHGAIGAGEWVVMRTDWDKRAHDEALFLNADETGPHSPGPTAEVHRVYLLARASSAGAASASAPTRGRPAA